MTEKTTEEYTVNARVFGFSATDGIIEEQDVSALFPKRKRIWQDRVSGFAAGVRQTLGTRAGKFAKIRRGANHAA